MIETLLFPFRLLYFIILTIMRIIGFFFGVSLRTARFMAGGLFAVGIGVLIGLLLGRKFGGKKPSMTRGRQ
jgi:hypothetical protein